MIYTDNEPPEVGSEAPTSLMTNLPDLSEHEALSTYFATELWKTGTGALITGAAGSGKTRMGIAMLRGISKVDSAPQRYWTEHDFLADLQVLWRYERMVTNDRSDGLWNDYVEWERDFWGAKQGPVLFLDDVGEGYTPMHRNEVMSLLRLRLNKGLPTIVAVDSSLMESLTPQFRSLLIRNTIMVGT